LTRFAHVGALQRLLAEADHVARLMYEVHGHLQRLNCGNYRQEMRVLMTRVNVLRQRVELALVAHEADTDVQG
jgi:hypothetical protein